VGIPKFPGTGQGTIVAPTQQKNPILNFSFAMVPGAIGTELMDFAPSSVVVTNPFNYYIYFPDCNQWVAPRAYNFVFAYSPSAPNTLRWNSTVDPLGNAQVKNPALIANGTATNDVSRYNGGSTAPVPPTSVFTGTFIQPGGITKGDYYGFAFADLAGNITEIAPTASIYSVTILFQVLIAGWVSSAQNLWMTFRVGFAYGTTYSDLTLAAGGFVETGPSSGDSVTAYSSVTYSPASPIPVSSLLAGGGAVQGMYVVMDNVASNSTVPGIAFSIAASVVAG